MQTLYEWDFQTEKPVQELLTANLTSVDHADGDRSFVESLVMGTAQHVSEIDQKIAAAAPEWPMDQISVVDKSILRLAIYELEFLHDVPAKVAINEAVELAKTFGGDNTSKFINGVLGTIYRQSDRFSEEKKETTDADQSTA